jgi:hypothetical protein
MMILRRSFLALLSAAPFLKAALPAPQFSIRTPLAYDPSTAAAMRSPDAFIVAGSAVIENVSVNGVHVPWVPRTVAAGDRLALVRDGRGYRISVNGDCPPSPFAPPTVTPGAFAPGTGNGRGYRISVNGD